MGGYRRKRENEPMEQIKQYLTFMMRDEEYALSVSHVKEVLEVPRLTRVPRMPEYMSGVINLRGSVVPVVDLRNKFGMTSTEIGPLTAIIVVEIPIEDTDKEGLLTVGIFADAVHKVLTIESDEIEPPPKIGHAIDTAYIKGMGHVGDDFIILLDIAEILSAEDLKFAEQSAS